MTHGSSCVA